MQSSRRRLQVHTGGLAPLRKPTAEQLELAEANHPTVQARIRAVDQAVRAGTYRGRDGRPHPFTARHQLVMLRLCLYADRNGEVRPEVITLVGLADELGRDRANVRREVRELGEALLITSRRAGPPGSPFVFMIPGMIAPSHPRR